MWKNDEYYYGVGTLRAIAYHYESIYEGISFILGNTVTDQWAIAEYKRDFDKALDAMGWGHWTGDIENKEFKDLKRFGKLQHIVIADIYNMSDSELEALGFYNPSKYKSIAYRKMAKKLNGGET